MSKHHDLQEEVQQIFQNISRESQSLQDIDIGPLVEEWKQICQSLRMHIQEDSTKECDDSYLDDTYSGNDAHTDNANSFNKSDLRQNTGQEVPQHIHEHDDIIEIELAMKSLKQDEEGTWINDTCDDANNISQQEAADIDSAILENSNIFTKDPNISDYQDLPYFEDENTESALIEPTVGNDVTLSDSAIYYLEISSDGDVPWDIFEEHICNGDEELVSKCKTSCHSVEESILLVDNNMRILTKIQELQKRLKQIYHDNSILIGGPNALEHVEQRSKGDVKIMYYHQEMKDVLLKIKRTFPGSEKVVANGSKVSPDVDSPENSFIESRSVPHFLK